jgi:hypothetical protein
MATVVGDLDQAMNMVADAAGERAVSDNAMLVQEVSRKIRTASGLREVLKCKDASTIEPNEGPMSLRRLLSSPAVFLTCLRHLKHVQFLTAKDRLQLVVS